ncbi:guanine deaminase [Orussus abietinus]|uniref:guanine deaminase n=1 Tax=Orussus abietinus TaxID=222816 RepID=UPI0006260E31|nr:guanine deaminase [Orussus abietinus]XP_012280212.1 guanine deaminase [Orussus abietinus]XP_012280213.1 guanine deaminase [Orussus abietinus]XP_023290158.1 guanine deaminase [Orussus abietinus]
MVQHLFIGPLIHFNNEGELRVVENAEILVEDGKITRVVENQRSKDVAMEHVTRLENGQFFVPGFVDCHIHAAQIPNLGIGYDKPLLDWLEHYTFPLEKKFQDQNFARRVYEAVVKRTISVGTTTACYFASLYGESSKILGQKAAQYGQRAFIGKVNMNNPHENGYFESTTESVSKTLEFIQAINEIGSSLVKPIITPRFVLSCDMELMTMLGNVAREMDLHVQTHIAENLEEVKIVSETFKQHSSYAAIYHAAGLLTKKTLLAHGIYLSDEELILLKNQGTSIVHCPSSNTCLKSGLCDVQRLKRFNIKIGLGTDVSGGHSACMLEVMRAAIQVSCHLALLTTNYQPLNYKDVFYLATLGGATALTLDDKIGNLVPGKDFDALVVDLNVHDGPLDNLCEYTLEEKLQRFIHSGDDRNIVEVYIAGQRVK